MNIGIISALVRHVLTALAGGLAVRYSIDGASMDAIAGGITAVIGVGWSIWQKRGSAVKGA